MHVTAEHGLLGRVELEHQAFPVPLGHWGSKSGQSKHICLSLLAAATSNSGCLWILYGLVGCPGHELKVVEAARLRSSNVPWLRGCGAAGLCQAWCDLKKIRGC